MLGRDRLVLPGPRRRRVAQEPQRRIRGGRELEAPPRGYNQRVSQPTHPAAAPRRHRRPADTARRAHSPPGCTRSPRPCGGTPAATPAPPGASPLPCCSCWRRGSGPQATGSPTRPARRHPAGPSGGKVEAGGAGAIASPDTAEASFSFIPFSSRNRCINRPRWSVLRLSRSSRARRTPSAPPLPPGS